MWGKTVFVHNFPFVDMELKWGNLGQIQILSLVHRNNGFLELEKVLELIVSRALQATFRHSPKKNLTGQWGSKRQVGEDGCTICKTDNSKAAQDGGVMNVHVI